MIADGVLLPKERAVDYAHKHAVGLSASQGSKESSLHKLKGENLNKIRMHRTLFYDRDNILFDGLKYRKFTCCLGACSVTVA